MGYEEELQSNPLLQLLHGNATSYNFQKTIEKLLETLATIISKSDQVITPVDNEKINSLIEELSAFFNMQDNPGDVFLLQVIAGLRLFYWRRLSEQQRLLNALFAKLSAKQKAKYQNEIDEYNAKLNKTYLQYSIEYVKQHPDLYKVLFPFYDQVQDEILVPKYKNRKKINFYNWISDITSHNKRISVKAIKQQFQTLCSE